MHQRILQLKKEGKLYAVAINLLIGVLALLGVLLACIYATRDGYSAWPRRMLYFTQQSNLWIAVVSLVFAILLLRPDVKKRRLRLLGLLKYIFTVSITVTGIVFCGLLAPFAHMPVWYLSNVLTHVVVPVLAVIDFFTDKWIPPIHRKNVVYALIPPAAWFAFASFLCALRVDFGKGVAYPYFFMDFYSEVGLFGIRLGGELPLIGSFYWLIVMLMLTWGLCFAYRAWHERLWRKRETRGNREETL